MNQRIYQLISFLLNYPTEEMIDILPEIEMEVEGQSNSQIKGNIKQFIQQSKEMSLDNWITHYIEHFDFGKLTNLYVTYLKLGEQRERGLELLKLKKYYEAHGFEVTDKELPDYLPVILEFAANVPVEVSNELLAMHHQAIGEIHGKLVENNSYYRLLFEALFLCMEENGVTAAALDEA